MKKAWKMIVLAGIFASFTLTGCNEPDTSVEEPQTPLTMEAEIGIDAVEDANDLHNAIADYNEALNEATNID